MKYGILTMLYTIFLDVLVFTTFALRQNELVYEFNQRQYDIQINYATDAAAWMMLHDTADIDIDYADLASIRVDPNVALQTYEAMMVRGFGWSDDTENREAFEDLYMPFFVVAAYDGYYIYSVIRQDINSNYAGISHAVNQTVYPKTWTPKIPYAEFSADNKYINIYNLGAKDYKRYSYDSGLYQFGIVYSDLGGAATNAKSTDMKQYISNTLTEVCQKCLVMAKGEVADEQIIIPADFSEWSSNRPVEYPTVLTYLDISSSKKMYEHQSFAVGGSRIENTTYYIGYVAGDGIKKYTLATNRDIIEGVDGYEIKQVFTSDREAAKAGYYYDMRFITD